MKKIIKFFILFLLLKRLALRYIDPNSGGMLFQFLAVIFALLSTAFLFFSGKIKAVFARFRRFVRELGNEGEQNIGGKIDDTSEDNFETDV